MKKVVLHSIIAISLFLILVFGYVIYNEEFSKEAITGKSNVENFRKVELGMDSLTVLKIMGQPREKYIHKGKTFYNYNAPPGSSFQCQLILNKMEE